MAVEEKQKHALDDQFESGLPDDFDGKVTDVTFMYHDKYMNGEVAVAQLTIASDELDEPIEVLYPCGKGWEPSRDGSTLKHESGKPKRLNRQSALSLLAYHAYDAGFTSVSGDNILVADTLRGLTFHWNRIAFNYGGEIGQRERLLPTKLIDGGDKKAGKAGKAGKAASSSGEGKASTKAAAGKNDGVDEAIRAALTEAAQGADTYDAFVEAAFAIDGVDGNGAAERLVANKAWYAEARAAA